MPAKIQLYAGVAVALLFTTLSACAQGHAHIEAGAFLSGGSNKLFFANGGSYVTNSGYCEAMFWRAAGTYANHHEGTLTFTGLPGSPFSGGPAPDAAPLGTQIKLRVVSVQGPVGGSFGVWDVDGFNFDENESDSLTFSLPAGTTDGTHVMLVSENLGESDADPYGHIHGRHYSATVPGLYTVGFQLFDASANGPGGGPLCLPSDVLYLHFQAGFTNPPFTLYSNRMEFRFGSLPGRSYHLDATNELGSPTAWSNISSVTGAKALRTLLDTNIAGPRKFYRVRMTTP